jgi:hypothetical protein
MRARVQHVIQGQPSPYAHDSYVTKHFHSRDVLVSHGVPCYGTWLVSILDPANAARPPKEVFVVRNGQIDHNYRPAFGVPTDASADR